MSGFFYGFVQGKIGDMSDNRLAKDYWGPAGWKFMHAQAFSYPDTPTKADRKSMYKYISLFAKLLPCPLCCRHFESYVAGTIPTYKSVPLSCRLSFARWSVDAHNEVNARLGKQIKSFEEIAAFYDISLETCSSNHPVANAIVLQKSCEWMLPHIVCIVLVLILLSVGVYKTANVRSSS